jgi:hypothetical protein
MSDFIWFITQFPDATIEDYWMAVSSANGAVAQNKLRLQIEYDDRWPGLSVRSEAVPNAISRTADIYRL